MRDKKYRPSKVESAEEAFALYDMGDMVVKETSGWCRNDPFEWSMPVFIENGDDPSVRLLFVVRFDTDGSNNVIESYFAY